MALQSTYPYTQCAAVITQRGVIREPPQLLFSCTTQGHEPGFASCPLMIRLVPLLLNWFPWTFTLPHSLLAKQYMHYLQLFQILIEFSHRNVFFCLVVFNISPTHWDIRFVCIVLALHAYISLPIHMEPLSSDPSLQLRTPSQCCASGMHWFPVLHWNWPDWHVFKLQIRISNCRRAI